MKRLLLALAAPLALSTPVLADAPYFSPNGYQGHPNRGLMQLNEIVGKELCQSIFVMMNPELMRDCMNGHRTALPNAMVRGHREAQRHHQRNQQNVVQPIPTPIVPPFRSYQ